MAEGFIPVHGGYEELLAYQRSQVVYDATFKFCSDYFQRFDRTIDQMVQAARSGKQNIIEGSLASATSKETEIKLTNVAKASLGELLEDYRDIMRTKGFEEWSMDHRYARRLSALCRVPNANYATFKKAVEHQDQAIRVNAIAGLTKVTIFLLKRQIEQLEQDFLKNGGLRERMYRARVQSRERGPKGLKRQKGHCFQCPFSLWGPFSPS